MWYYSYPDYKEMTNLPFYLVGIGQHELQPYIAKPKGHPRDQFFYSVNGTGYLKMLGTSVKVPEKSGFYIPAGVPHTYYPCGDIWDLRWLSCGGSGISALCAHTGIRSGEVRPVATPSSLDAILNRMHMELICDNAYGNYFASSYINEFILEFAKQCGLVFASGASETAGDVYERNMNIIRDYVEYHFMYRITMEDLCNLVHVTPQHLCRIIKTCTGKRPTEYINIVRIEKAKNMLAGTDETIETVALWSGFENNNYFCRTFKKLVGMTPKQYRRKND